MLKQVLRNLHFNISLDPPPFFLFPLPGLVPGDLTYLNHHGDDGVADPRAGTGPVVVVVVSRTDITASPPRAALPGTSVERESWAEAGARGGEGSA